MLTLPQHIKQTFFEVMNGETDLPTFEQWVYTSTELEQTLPSQLYLDLIEFDYKKSATKYELHHLLEKHIDKGEYETYKLKHLLSKARQPNLALPGTLEVFYDMYCHGYSFLDVLGLQYGLTVTYLPGSYSAQHWRELPEEELQQLANNLSISLAMRY